MPDYPITLTLDHDLMEHSIFQISDQVLFREIEQEAVLLHITNGSYYSLNETSLPFWQAIQEQLPLMDVVESIVRDYGVTREQVLADLQQFLEQLLAFNLITQVAQT